MTKTNYIVVNSPCIIIKVLIDPKPGKEEYNNNLISLSL